MGPLKDAMLLTDKTSEEHILLDVYACRRVPEAESEILEDCAPEWIRLTDCVKGDFVHF